VINNPSRLSKRRPKPIPVEIFVPNEELLKQKHISSLLEINRENEAI